MLKNKCSILVFLSAIVLTVQSCSGSNFSDGANKVIKKKESRNKNEALAESKGSDTEILTESTISSQGSEVNADCLVGLVGFYLPNHKPVWKIVSKYPKIKSGGNSSKFVSFAQIAATEKAVVDEGHDVIEENFGIFLYPRAQTFNEASPEVGNFFSRGFIELQDIHEITPVKAYSSGLDLIMIPGGLRVEAFDKDAKPLTSRDGPAILMDSNDYEPLKRGSLQVLESISQYPASLEAKLKSVGFGVEKIVDLSATRSIRVSTIDSKKCPSQTN